MCSGILKIGMLLCAGLMYQSTAHAACAPSAIDPRALHGALVQIQDARKAMTRSVTASHPDARNIIEIGSAVAGINANVAWMIDVIVIHASMRDSADQKFVADLFQQRVPDVVDVIDINARAIDETTGFIKTAGTAAQATALSSQVAALKRIVAACK